MIRLAYYWSNYDHTGHTIALGTYADEADALRNGLAQLQTLKYVPDLGAFRLSPWYPSAFAPEPLSERMGRSWNPIFDFAIVSRKYDGGPVGYLFRSPSQTLDPE